eukprot:CAMPEP_0180119664 /NCGR_PEP_ID=MMETSP0986-20121125/2108_1 /TAXON_ID=697907 /ORGANISM="non described non described, Strain CCMP2293" /LENGTH=85 /DNA_ID=CAMNT_0022058691 /DNA_START=78 /DNA_END=331 /DNA_ORIENTATION=-
MRSRASHARWSPPWTASEGVQLAGRSSASNTWDACTVRMQIVPPGRVTRAASDNTARAIASSGASLPDSHLEGSAEGMACSTPKG